MLMLIIPLMLLTNVYGGHLDLSGFGQKSDGVGDYHNGVSIVNTNSNQGAKLDLTNHGALADQHHDGLFGGSFISSSKYGGHEEGELYGHGGGLPYGLHSEHGANLNFGQGDYGSFSHEQQAVPQVYEEPPPDYGHLV